MTPMTPLLSFPPSSSCFGLRGASVSICYEQQQQQQQQQKESNIDGLGDTSQGRTETI